MAIFRTSDSSGNDRSAGDRARHRQKIKDALRGSIADIVSEESIIGADGDKVIKVPIKGIKEYQFVYGSNRSSAQQGREGMKRGQVIPQKGKSAGAGKAGKERGEDVYEVEVTIDEIIKVLFEDLSLSDLERKKSQKLKTEKVFKRQGYRTRGIRPRLSEERTVINRMARKKAGQLDNPDFNPDDNFPFSKDDFAYRHITEKEKKHSNAVVILMMDVSGSMDTMKKYLARAFFFFLHHFIKTKYEHTDLVFIAHHTDAKEVNEEEFFHKGESGGTQISSAYEKALEIIKARYSPSLWNIYAFHCSDGDNYPEDNNKAILEAQKICNVANLFGYIEIKMQNEGTLSISNSSRRYYPMPQEAEGMLKLLRENVKSDNFSAQKLTKKVDVYSCLRAILKKEMEG